MDKHENVNLVIQLEFVGLSGLLDCMLSNYLGSSFYLLIKGPSYLQPVNEVLESMQNLNFRQGIQAIFQTKDVAKDQRENRLRDSLEKCITLQKARAVYLGRLEQNQNFSQIKLLEILYILFSGYETKSENPLFFSWPPMPLEIKLPPRG